MGTQLIREYLNRDESDIDINKIIEESKRELFGEDYDASTTPITSKIEEKTEKDYSGCGCLALTFIFCLPVFMSMIFYFSKIFGYIDWAWWRVFLPCILSYGGLVVLTILLLIVGMIMSYTENKKSKKLVDSVKDYKDKLEDTMKEVE